MSELMGQLFGLDDLAFGQESVHLSFARPMASWAWAMIVMLMMALAAWSYWRLAGSRMRRVALATVRGLLLILLFVLIAGPQLVRPNKRVEQDWVIVLVDRSASMSIPDLTGADGSRISREEQLRDAVAKSWPMWSELAADRTVLWLGFDAGAFDLSGAGPEDQPDGIDLGEPGGRRTSLGQALEQALRRAAARPVSGIVILSDGRSVDEPDRAVMRRLASDRIPVFAVPLGSAEPMMDLALTSVEAPAMAFIDDRVPVSVRVSRLGEAGDIDAPGMVQLVDTATGLVLDQRPLPPQDRWDADGATLTLVASPDIAGERTWAVRLIPGGPDLIQENNTAAVSVELVDRPMRVVQFDGYPRWEFRYLKNLLLREPSIRSSSVLLSASKRYIQEGDELLAGIPSSPEEWTEFDVIVMGDLRPELFSDDQLSQIRDHIAQRGAGLLWIAGQGPTPGAWRGTPLEDLFPFTIRREVAFGDSDVWDEPVTVVRAEGAERLGLLELGETTDEDWAQRIADPRTGWSQLRWAQRINPDSLKPTAEVLAHAVPVSADGQLTDEASPLLLSMRYGAGRVLYVATDEIWRWRYGRGETLFERFWLPLIRLQGRESLSRSGQPAILEATPRRALVDQPVRVAIKLLDQALLDARPAALTVRIQSTGRLDDELTAPVDLTLAPDQTGTFATTWIATESGMYTVEAVDPVLSGLGLEAEVEVSLPDDEMRRPETDHVLLASLSEQTNGAVLLPDDLSSLPGLLPRWAVTIEGKPDIETLWDKPIVLVLLMLLLTVEWVGRKMMRLA